MDLLWNHACICVHAIHNGLLDLVRAISCHNVSSLFDFAVPVCISVDVSIFHNLFVRSLFLVRISRVCMVATL